MNHTEVAKMLELFIEPVLAQHRWCESCVYTHQHWNRVGFRGENAFVKHTIDFNREFRKKVFNTTLTHEGCTKGVLGVGMLKYIVDEA
jgi:hypothetical protein